MPFDFSSILTTASSIRTRFSTSEADGATPEDTHICRVLRAYYSEQRRPFPEWLPPDPREKQSGFGRDDNSVFRRGGGQETSGNLRTSGGMSMGRQGVLSDLWGDSAGSASGGAQETQSLRRGGRGTAPTQPGLYQTNSAQPGGRLQVPSRPGSDSRSYSTESAPQRMESVSAQDRLKARLFGGTGRVNAGSGSLSPHSESYTGRR